METLTAIFISMSAQFGLPNGLLSSVCYVETKHQVNAVHVDDGDEDSLGVCQVKLKTARWLGFKGTEKQLMKPKVNAYYAAKMLRHQLTRYNGNVTKAVIAYNRGSARHYSRTRYSDKVMIVWQSTGENR